MKTLKGNITIGRVRVGEISEVFIKLIDELSGCQVVEVRLPAAVFADVLFGPSRQGCEFDFNDGGLVGMSREVKSVVVLVPTCDRKNQECVIREAVAAHETDGWRGNDEDATNRHRRRGSTNGGSYYEVTFRRWVPVQEVGK